MPSGDLHVRPQSLRELPPIWCDSTTGFYHVRQWSLAKKVLLDSRRFSAEKAAQASVLHGPFADAIRSRYHELGAIEPGPFLAQRDDPEHRHLRNSLRDYFRPERVYKLAAFIRTLAHELIDGFIERGHCELVSEFAVPLSFTTILHMLGAPTDSMWEIRARSDAWIERIGGVSTPDRAIWCTDLEILQQRYLQPIIDQLRQVPQPTMLSEIVNAVIPEWGRPLSDAELHAELNADFFAGGSESVSNVISYTLSLLAKDDGQWQWLRSASDEEVQAFVEEAIRIASPVQVAARVANECVDLDGVIVPAGTIVMVDLGMANRDETVFQDAPSLRIPPPKHTAHLAFGAGTHHCLGVTLARLELLVAFSALRDRLTTISITSGKEVLVFKPNSFLRGLDALHLTFAR